MVCSGNSCIVGSCLFESDNSQSVTVSVERYLTILLSACFCSCKYLVYIPARWRRSAHCWTECKSGSQFLPSPYFAFWRHPTACTWPVFTIPDLFLWGYLKERFCSILRRIVNALDRDIGFKLRSYVTSCCAEIWVFDTFGESFEIMCCKWRGGITKMLCIKSNE
jgi:hypothetical protein